MNKSITETLKKINIDISSFDLMIILFNLILISLFLIYKIQDSSYFKDKEDFQYIKSNIILKNTNTKNLHFIYASKRGKKYYFYNCKSSIKEANKIYFDSEASAQKAGYTLSKTCK